MLEPPVSASSTALANHYANYSDYGNISLDDERAVNSKITLGKKDLIGAGESTLRITFHQSPSPSSLEYPSHRYMTLTPY